MQQVKTIIYHHRTQAQGAEGVHIRGIKNALKEKGFNIIDISLINTDCGVKNKQYSNKLTATFYSIITNKIPNSLFKLIEIFYPIRAYFAGNIALKKKEEISFVYDRYAYFSFGMPLLSKKTGIPLLLEVNTTCLDYDVRKIRFKKLTKIIEKYCFNNSDLIIVVSGYLKNKICTEYNINPKKIIITPNAVNPKDFSIQAQRKREEDVPLPTKSEGDIFIGFVGVFVPWHGLDLLLKAFKLILDERKKANKIKLILVGDGPMRPIIDKFISENLLSTKILVTGLVSHEQVKFYIDLFDIAVMPDSNPFGSPMKIFEYMVMGKAIVAPEYGPILEVIQHRRNGLIFKTKEINNLVKMLVTLIDNPSLCKELGKQAQVDIHRNHTWAHNVKRILEFANNNGIIQSKY